MSDFEFDFCGHRTPEQDLLCLRKLVEEIDAKRVIEVGCFVGQSAIALAGEGREVYCIDTFEGPVEFRDRKAPAEYLDTFLKNVGKRYPKQVKPIMGRSLAWSQNFKPGFADLIFLDASHEFDDICRDIDAWWKVLRDGGLMVLHDAFVINAVNKAAMYCFGKDARVAQRDILCPRVDLPLKPKVPTNLFVIQK